jgi:hypothetical protein
MSRGAQQFTAVENKIDRGMTKQRREEADALQVQAAASIMHGALGGLVPERAVSQAFAIADAALDHALALADPETVVAWCGMKAGRVGRPLDGPKAQARVAAERQFTKASA